MVCLLLALEHGPRRLPVLVRFSRAAHLAEHLERRDWCHQRLWSVRFRVAREGHGSGHRTADDPARTERRNAVAHLAALPTIVLPDRTRGSRPGRGPGPETFALANVAIDYVARLVTLAEDSLFRDHPLDDSSETTELGVDQRGASEPRLASQPRWTPANRYRGTGHPTGQSMARRRKKARRNIENYAQTDKERFINPLVALVTHPRWPHGRRRFPMTSTCEIDRERSALNPTCSSAALR